MKSGNLFVFLLCAFFFSCAMHGSDSEDEGDDGASDLFLKAQIEQKSNQNNWSEPISAPSLAKTLSLSDSSLQLTPQIAAAAINFSQPPVFPYIKGFGSLDTTNLSSDAKNALDGFCAAISEKEGYDFMQENREYELSIFFFDLEDKWYSLFKSDFPKESIFSSWKYAAPIFVDDFILETVRFFLGEQFLDAEIYLFESTDGWKVNQIRAKWRSENDSEQR